MDKYGVRSFGETGNKRTSHFALRTPYLTAVGSQRIAGRARQPAGTGPAGYLGHHPLSLPPTTETDQTQQPEGGEGECRRLGNGRQMHPAEPNIIGGRNVDLQISGAVRVQTRQADRYQLTAL